MFRLSVLSIIWFYLCGFASSEIKVNERHSFSLTTFDPDGKLDQVERATRGAHLGAPVMACVSEAGEIFMVSPQVLPSPLMLDDGTARFSKVSRGLVVAHTGIDGRLVVSAAQRLAIEHELAFDEEIRVDSFLEEMSLLFQNYTMRQGHRPFGCTLMVGSLTTKELYRIDPSGSVVAMGTSGAIGSLSDRATPALIGVSTMEDLQETLRIALEESIRKATKANHSATVVRLVAATFDGGGISVERFQMEDRKRNHQ